MNSGEPGSPRRRGPPRQAYQYVWPLAVTLAIPLSSTLTIARLPFGQLPIERILPLRLARYNLDHARVDIDADARHLQASSRRRPDQAGNITLPEGGRAARHQP